MPAHKHTLLLFTTLVAICATLYPPRAQTLPSSSTLTYTIISKGGDAGDYQAFPDAYRLQNGDIVAVFYAGYGHISHHNDAYPKAGRICLVRSTDEGRTWSLPRTIYDDADDNRDPHISQLKDGTLIVTMFSLLFDPADKKKYRGTNPQIIRSRDNGQTWDATAQTIPTGDGWYCSSQLKEMPNGTLMLPVYYQKGGGTEMKAWGGVIFSSDKGQTWGSVIPIGETANLPLAAETDVITLRDGTLFAALRGQRETQMHFATSTDAGKTWSAVQPSGFVGHSPAFTRLKSGPILLAYRGFGKGGDFKTAYTALRVSFDEGKTWEGPYLLDKSGGAYPSTIELNDGSVLAIFYEEGENSGVGATRFRVPKRLNQAPNSQPVDQPLPLQVVRN